jgi:molybdopterin-guanine dinucleotide biosynthesis protein
MATIVIGGHTRNIGKTSVVCALISALPERHWTAMKITQFGHGVCSANGEPCDCETADHTIAISEERSADTGTDSSRYLAAGAIRSLWVRTRVGQLAEAMPRIRTEIARAENVIVESNSILRFLRPDFSASVLDPDVADFKPTALRYLDRVDAILVAGGTLDRPEWKDVSLSLIESIPRFQIVPPNYSSSEFAAFVSQKLAWVER